MRSIGRHISLPCSFPARAARRELLGIIRLDRSGDPGDEKASQVLTNAGTELKFL
jgi:hypothetical protein